MKYYKLIILNSIVLLMSLVIVSCEGAEDEEFGNALLYIPQAVSQDIDDNNYDVSLKQTAREDTAIAVGLYRSGLQKLQSVTVDLLIDEAKLNEQISNADTKFKDAKLLPAEYYNLPPTISLKDGERDTWVKLEIKKSLLLEQWTDSSVKYVLPIRIANPTRYELNEKLSIVYFVFQKK